MVDGAIAEIGSYSELLAADGALAKLVAEHVSESNKEAAEKDVMLEEQEEIELKQELVADELKQHVIKTGEENKVPIQAEGEALMLKEEREIGAVSWAVYKAYIGK